MEKQYVLLTIGIFAVEARDDERSSFLATDQWVDAYVSVNLFHARHVWEFFDSSDSKNE